MKVTVTGPLVHLCPYVDELDVGTVELCFGTEGPYEGQLFELHALRRFLDSFRGQMLTHEQVTDVIAREYPTASVTTKFVTAGLEVTCTA